jgi:hypothetical protein
MYIFKSNNILSFIPGAINVNSVEDSQNLNDIARYKTIEIFEELLKTGNISESYNDSEDIFEWKIKWKKNNRYIIINFTSLEDDIWGGSNLITDCFFDDLLTIWLALRKRYKRIWIHDNECNIYNPVSFIEYFISSRLEGNYEKDKTINKFKKLYSFNN